MYIRYNKKNKKVVWISSVSLKNTKETDVIQITKTEYNKIKNKELKQLYVFNWKINYIQDDVYNSIKLKKEEEKLKQKNRKIIEKKILDKYPYWKQINNIYLLLNVLEPFLKDLVKDGSEQEKAILNSTYSMISDIFNDLVKYKEAQKNKTRLSFQDNETNENDNN